MSAEVPAGPTWKYLPVEVSPEDTLDVFRQYLSFSRPEWQGKPLEKVVFSEGLTNKLVGFYNESKQDIVLVRINGNNTDLFINRELEIVTMITLSQAGLSSPVYYQFQNGLCYGFTPGRVLKFEELHDLDMAKRIAKTLARFHSVPIPQKFQRLPRLYEFFDNFLAKITGDFGNEKKNKRFLEVFGNKEVLQGEVAGLKAELDKLDCPLVMSHNDLLLGNVIYDEDNDTVLFIDFEYGGPNPRAFDIANHFCEYAGIDIKDIDFSRYPDKPFQCEWIKMYLKELSHLQGHPVDISEDDIEELYRQVNKYALASHLKWSIWSLVQAKYSEIDFDYIEYSRIKFAEYKARKEKFLSL